MKNSLPHFFLLSVIILQSCSNSSNKADESSSVPAKAAVSEADKASSNSPKDDEESVKKRLNIKSSGEWNIDDFTSEVKGNEYFKGTVKNKIKDEMIHWKGVENPIVADFDGVIFGDYFYIYFKGENGKKYTFSSGDHDFGQYTLYDENQNSNPKYVGKKFKIYWDWRKSSFPCCQGGYKKTVAHQPTILKLELINN